MESHALILSSLLAFFFTDNRMLNDDVCVRKKLWPRLELQ